MSILLCKRISISYLNILADNKKSLTDRQGHISKKKIFTKRQGHISKKKFFTKRNRYISKKNLVKLTSSPLLPSLKDLGLHQENLGVQKRFFDAFFKTLLDTQMKGSKLNLELKQNLGYEVYKGYLHFADFSAINLKKLTDAFTGLKDLYPLFNQVSLSLNDCLRLINDSFKTSLPTSVTLYSPLDTPKIVISHFYHSLSVPSMLLNGFFGIDHSDSQVLQNFYFSKALQEFNSKKADEFFEIHGLNDVYLQVRQDISSLYTNILQLRTKLLLIL